MINWLSNLLQRANQVKIETQDLANTALRIGQLFIDALRGGVHSFDPNLAYEERQYVVFEGVLAQCVVATNAGETPKTHPVKWSLKLVLDPAQVNVSNDLPVAASVLAKMIAGINNMTDGVANATKYVKGIARQATDEEVNEAVVDDAWISPKQLNGQLAGLGGGNGVKTPTWQQTTDQPGGNVTTNPVKAQSFTKEFEDPVDNVNYIGAFVNQGLAANGKPVDQREVTITKSKLGQIALVEAPDSSINDFTLRQVDLMSPEVARQFALKLPGGTGSGTGSGNVKLRPVLLGCIDEPAAGTSAGQSITVQNPQQDQQISHSMTAGAVWPSAQSFNSVTIIPINSNHVKIHFDEGVDRPAELTFKLDYKNAV